MIRINLCVQRQKIPNWFDQLRSDLYHKFAIEYIISDDDAKRYFTSTRTSNLSETDMNESDRRKILLLRNVALFHENGIKAISYNIDNLPSYGLLLPEDDPTVVEYKFRYLSADKE